MDKGNTLPLKSIVLNILHRLSMMLRDAVVEMEFLISVEMMGSWSDRGQGAGTKAKELE